MNDLLQESKDRQAFVAAAQWHRSWCADHVAASAKARKQRAPTLLIEASLKHRFPLIPPHMLERATLRQVSVAVRKIGDGQSSASPPAFW